MNSFTRRYIVGTANFGMSIYEIRYSTIAIDYDKKHILINPIDLVIKGNEFDVLIEYLKPVVKYTKLHIKTCLIALLMDANVLSPERRKYTNEWLAMQKKQQHNKAKRTVCKSCQITEVEKANDSCGCIERLKLFFNP